MSDTNSKSRIVLRDVAVTSSAKFVGGILTLLLNVVLIAVWAPETYGAWAFCFTAVLLADAVIGGPFDLAVIRLAQALVNDGSTDAGYAALAVERAAFVLKCLAVAALAGGASTIASFSERTDAAALAIASSAATAGLLGLRSGQTHLQMRRRFQMYGAIELIHLCVRFALAAGLIWNGAGPVGVLWAFAVAPLVALAIATAIVLPTISVPAEWDRAAMRKVLRCVFWYGPTLALGATIGRLDMIMLGALGVSAQLGIYGAAGTIASIPELAGAYLGIALTPALVARAQIGQSRGLFVRGQAALLAIASSGYLVALGAASSPLVDLAPPAYRSAVPVLLILLPGTLAGMTTTPLAFPLVMLARKRFLLTIDVFVAPAAVVAYAWFIPSHGVIGVAAVASAIHILRSAAVQAMAWRLSSQVHDLAKA